MTTEFLKDDNDIVPVADLQGLRLASEMLKILNNHYPGYRWAVDFDEMQGVAKIVNFTLLDPLQTREMYGYILHLKTVYEDQSNQWRKLIRAGGEILERAYMDRKAWDRHTYPKKIDGIPIKHQPLLDAHGDVVLL
jgi:hypothetical protein